MLRFLEKCKIEKQIQHSEKPMFYPSLTLMKIKDVLIEVCYLPCFHDKVLSVVVSGRNTCMQGGKRKNKTKKKHKCGDGYKQLVKTH